MTTVSDLVNALNNFGQDCTVNGAETLTVSVTSQTPVLSPPPVDAPTEPA